MIYDPKLIKTFKPNDDNSADCECGNHIIPGTADMVRCACGRVFVFIGELNGIEVFESPVDGVYFLNLSKLTKEQKRELEDEIRKGVRVRIDCEPEFWRGVTLRQGPG